MDSSGSNSLSAAFPPMNFLESLRTHWANFHPILRWLIVVLVVGGLLSVSYSPALSVYRTWRNDQDTQRAAAALAAGRFAEARDLAIGVVRRDNQRKDIYPTLLTAANELRDPRRADIAMTIFSDEHFSPDERLKAWKLICETAPGYGLIRGWSTFSESEKIDLERLLPLADRLLGDGLAAEASEILYAVPEPRPVEVEYRLLKAFLVEGSAKASEELQLLLIRLVEQRPEMRDRLLDLLDGIPQDQILPDLYAMLTMDNSEPSRGDISGVLRLARSEIAAHPERAEGLIERCLAAYAEDEPELLVRWALQLQKPEIGADLLDLDEPAETLERFELQCEVLEASGKIKQLKALLENPPPRVPRWWVHCRMAGIIEDEKEQGKEAEKALKVATDSVESDTLILLAREAERRNLPQLALDAWTRAIIRRAGPLPISRKLKHVIRGLSEARRESELMEVLAAFRQLEPGNPVISVQFSYLACLTGRADPATVIQEIERIHESLPDQVPIISTLALARLLSGDASGAAELTDRLDVDWFGVNIAYRAIRGLILASTGQREEAEVFLGDFPWNDLLPSEKRVFREIARVAGEE